MRKKLKVRSERLRNLTPAVLAAIIGGVEVPPTNAECETKRPCWPDPPPR